MDPSRPIPERGSPATLVLATAGIVGGIAFAAGYVGPVLLNPSNNIGPLLGIFLTGPLGVLTGALIGVALWARRADAGSGAAAGWMVGIWSMTLLLSLFLARLVASWVLASLVPQVVAILATAALLTNERVRSRLSPAARRGGAVFIAVASAIVVLTLFPPVTKPWWGIAHSPPASIPKFAFLLDPGFDASHHIPAFAIDAASLCVEWLAVLAVGALGTLGIVVAARTAKRGEATVAR
ncbi:MAG: hypothetical protein ACHQ52_02270 [Candidatus Eisenbacteria bacterium]